MFKHKYQPVVPVYIPEHRYINSERALRIEKRQAREGNNVRKTVYHITQADPTNIVSVRRGCCRYCWGENYEYQRTDWELDRDLNRHLSSRNKAGVFNKMGGGGFVKTRDPNPNCPLCLGEGEQYSRIEDFRKLSHRDRDLIAGIKLGKNGQVEEVKFHNKIDAVMAFAKIDGMITEKKVVQVMQATEEELDQYFASNPITLDSQEFAEISNRSEGATTAESRQNESTRQSEASLPIAVESATNDEAVPPPVESRAERLRRLRAEGVMG